MNGKMQSRSRRVLLPRANKSKVSRRTFSCWSILAVFLYLCYTVNVFRLLEIASKEHRSILPTRTKFQHYSSRGHSNVLTYPKNNVKLLRLQQSARNQKANLATASTVIHILSHTHWDREWYMSLEEFRGSLVMELDRVLGMLTNSSASNFHHFHMDGQYLMIEDYLEVRPSMADTVANLNRQGKITLGPWYSQPDVFLASGEALIRNLMLGMSLSSNMGGTSTVGYLPDTFGFIGQVPQLLTGFGIHTFVSGRFANAHKSTEGYWIGPDGSSVLYAYLGNWYCHLRKTLSRPNTPQEAQTILMNLNEQLASKGAQSKHRLAMSGCDHYMTDPELGNSVEAINRLAASEQKASNTTTIVQTNLDDYMALLESDLKVSKVALPVVRGEVRPVNVDSLINSASTKMSVKQTNVKIQSLLEKWVEPMEAYGWALTRNMPDAARRPYDSDRIWHAWKPVLQTHAHDSICSTSASSVIHDIVNRLARSEQSTYRMLADQAGQVVPVMVQSLSGSDSSDSNTILVVNPTNTARSEVVMFTLYSTGDPPAFQSFRNVLDTTGWTVVSHPLVTVESTASTESFELPNTMFREKMKKSSTTFMAHVYLPANGVALLEPLTNPAAGASTLATIVEARMENNILENEFVSFDINVADGSGTLTHRASGQEWERVNTLGKTTEKGTSYKHVVDEGAYSTVSEMRIVSRKESAAFSSIQLQGMIGLSPVSITYVLFAGARYVQVQTTIENSERDNYVVASFPVKDGDEVHADGNFEYVDRTSMTDRYAHQNRFSSLSTKGRSLTVAVRGIPEYTISSDRQAWEITLIRGVNRVGDWIAGPLVDDISQELSTMTFEYALIPDSCRVTDPACTADVEARNFVDPVGSYANWVIDGYRPERYIDLDRSPLSVVAGLPVVNDAAVPPRETVELPLASLGTSQMFNIQPAKLVLSSVKKAEVGDGLVIRVYNPTAATLIATLSPGLIKFDHVRYVLLNENRPSQNEESLKVDAGDGGVFTFTAGPHKIVTILLKSA